MFVCVVQARCELVRLSVYPFVDGAERDMHNSGLVGGDDDEETIVYELFRRLPSDDRKQQELHGNHLVDVDRRPTINHRLTGKFGLETRNAPATMPAEKTVQQNTSTSATTHTYTHWPYAIIIAMLTRARVR